MRIDWWTLGLQTINALILIALLGRFLFRPVADIIASRKAEAARLLDEAAAAKATALQHEQAARKSLDDIAAGRSATIAAAVAEAEKQTQALMDMAHADAGKLRDAARADLAREAQTTRETQMKRAAMLAADIARRLLTRLPPQALVAGFIEGLAATAAEAPAQTKSDFDVDGPVALKAPRRLTPDEEADCRRALAAAFGRPLDMSLDVDPEIIAGFELENTHTAIRNSLRGDLARIVAALDKDEANDAGQSPA